MKIYLDAGHNYSGGDTGAQGNGHKEQDITFDIAKKTGERLSNQGVEVKYSRSGLTDNIGSTVAASIYGRYTEANAWGADYFISFHSNAASSSSALGTETLVYKLAGTAYELAKGVQSGIVSDCDMADRGVKQRTDLGVLKNTDMPAILIELGFITNQEDCTKMVNSPDLFAGAIAKSVCTFLNISWNGEDWTMSQYEELIARISAIENKMIYNYIDGNMPDWARPTIQKMVDRGYLKGSESGELGLDGTLLRVFVANDRAGLYDK